MTMFLKGNNDNLLLLSKSQFSGKKDDIDEANCYINKLFFYRKYLPKRSSHFSIFLHYLPAMETTTHVLCGLSVIAY